MNFFEREIAKYERRVKKIEANPDPNLLASNKLLYEIWVDYRKDELAAWQAGKPFAVLDGLGAERILTSMGFHTIGMAADADREVPEFPKHFETSKAMGLHDSLCDRIIGGMGMVFDGDLPSPAFCTTGNFSCSPHQLSVLAVARHYKVPHFMIDIPIEYSEDTVKYMAKQLEELIEFAEAKVPGTKFDMDQLVEAQEWEAKFMAHQKEAYMLRTVVPCPISGRDVIRMPRFHHTEPERSVQYSAMLAQEMKAKADSGKGALENEKLRFYWMVSAPFYANPFKFLEDRDVATVIFEFGGASRSSDYKNSPPGLGEPEFGRKLTPLEEEARWMGWNTWGGDTERRTQFVLDQVECFKIDGIVHFQQSGCPLALGSAQVIADRAEDELGIPSLLLEGRMLDEEFYNEEEVHEKLEEFIDLCLDRKEMALV